MLASFTRSAKRIPLKRWKNPPDVSVPEIGNTFRCLNERWQRYSSSSIDEVVTPHDDMHFASDENFEEYLRVGHSAVRIIAEAMLLAGRCEFGSVLDLPCGGGRVTRHLVKFLPESELFVADIDEKKEQFVIDRFDAKKFNFHNDYNGHPNRAFDLIFSGSLLTHFDQPMFDRALNYFIEALSPSGTAIVTLHGRNCASRASLQYEQAQRLRAEYLKRRRLRNALLRLKYRTTFDEKSAINKNFMCDGFGYFACPLWSRMYGQSYGGSYTAPSWTINRIEARTDCRILGYKEISFGNYQDVLIVQKI
ncbi:Methyltransferase domain-containing protein [Methylobacterium phyllostachyos]|uniref:Methyltransferase domain-containing protein n=1 Tax=Methylobacterium phyllostachyos TaxID=582672 RepID=A0A1G9RAP0_9HYPH|nr:class I SAM-dependent methyltransferase [Methylobacterium phyllostachyos]SDM20303.1 Methyltransferase domain-containing protein [Methylobacterium phyllostachyos]